MRSLRWWRFCLLCLAIAIASLAATAQNGQAQRPKEFNVCIGLDSHYARIEGFLPALAKSLLKNIPRQQKQVRVVAAGVEPGDAAAAAKAKGCDYLLQLSVLEVSGVGGAFSTGTFAAPDISPAKERERHELDWVRIDYRLRSLHDNALDVDGIDRVRFLEYPSAWDANAFETTVIRAVTRVAVASLDNLPKK